MFTGREIFQYVRYLYCKGPVRDRAFAARMSECYRYSRNAFDFREILQKTASLQLTARKSFFRLASLSMVLGFATLITKSASFLSFGNPCYVPARQTLERACWNYHLEVAHSWVILFYRFLHLFRDNPNILFWEYIWVLGSKPLLKRFWNVS